MTIIVIFLCPQNDDYRYSEAQTNDSGQVPKGGEEAGASGPSLGSATGGDFKGGPEVTRFQVVSFAISANFGFNLSVKVHARENPLKNGEFLVGF